MGVVIETCVKHPGGPTRIRGTDIIVFQGGDDGRGYRNMYMYKMTWWFPLNLESE